MTEQKRHDTWLRRAENDGWVARCSCGWGSDECPTVVRARELAAEHETEMRDANPQSD